eukprot:TRINITY_DN27638_c0_g1_i1.p1 TRINITY_DN27638_c0_g1~~TRINITY_DN27638_c0_g1_i1.p1  ORF type:complete len:155 (+),score=41.14 TRINITY_DN27638_c0_g1_i1:66-530(+)
MSSVSTTESISSYSESTPEVAPVIEQDPCEAEPVKRWWETIELRADSITGQKMKSMQGVIPSFMNGRDVNLQPGATIYSPGAAAEKKNNRKASKKRRQGRKKDRAINTRRSNNNSNTSVDTESECSRTQDLVWAPNNETIETTYDLSVMMGTWC